MGLSRKESFLIEFRALLKKHGIDYLQTSNKLGEGKTVVTGFIFDHDDGKNYGDNIVLTFDEFLDYIKKCKEKEKNDDPCMD